MSSECTTGARRSLYAGHLLPKLLAAVAVCGIAFGPAHADQCGDAIASANRAVEAEVQLLDELVGVSLSNPLADLNAAQCAARDRIVSLARATINLKRAAENICQGQNRTQCDSACAEQKLAERIAELNASCSQAAVPSLPQAAPRSPMRRQQRGANVCQCFSLQQFTRQGSQHPFKAVNGCPVAVSYTYTECGKFDGAFHCKETGGYQGATSESFKMYNDRQPASLVRACGPGGQCCTP